MQPAPLTITMSAKTQTSDAKIAALPASLHFSPYAPKMDVDKHGVITFEPKGVLIDYINSSNFDVVFSWNNTSITLTEGYLIDSLTFTVEDDTSVYSLTVSNTQVASFATQARGSNSTTKTGEIILTE